ncbi:ferrichrome ABC transporter [Anaerocolumna cellulosilytica]|uniref:Probable heme-iron transport system permease protein IsdF n=1 Tax=Anaerocolumna cellulosilytica TaxID=433286 RepID=A0A6S6R139_9FIRM|nr:iron ABC transporter permease [Anaerocolumna cellulosilytica]MBB5196900.1 iron complex transport system permease protein [Anaerocolumna cellulosilytica]BCJ92698.1 ferrichrome ABC transporter [Anaerocolumna cellulosilytica]
MKKIGAFVIVSILLVFGIIFSISVGSVNVPIQDIIEALFTKETGSVGIIRNIRIPRVIMGVLVGANLSVAGVLLQGVMRNPLADPGITGISSGASIVVMLIMLYFPKNTHMIPFYGFLGGMAACFMIYSLAWKKGITAVRIILAGVAVNAILGGVSSMMSILNSENLAGVLNWMNGSLGKKSWNEVKVMILYTGIGLVLAMPLAKSCNLLALGDKNAKSLGMNPNLHRILISLVAVFLAGVSTAYAGVISFVGLVVPHVARLLMGSDHKVLLPFAAILGSFVLVLADTLGRTVTAPYEIPVGVIMSVLGGPFFLYLLRKGENNYGS